MVNEKAKNSDILTPDGTRRSLSLDTIQQRGRKRSLSSISSTTKGLLHQHTTTREEADATRLLSKHSTPKLISSARQSESSRLLKLIPDLSQKEMGRLVGAIIKRRKRDAASGVRKQASARERSVLSSIPPLFPEKTPDVTRSQSPKVEMPARSAASTREEALRMLREARTEVDKAANPENEQHHHLDLAEELVYRASPR